MAASRGLRSLKFDFLFDFHELTVRNKLRAKTPIFIVSFCQYPSSRFVTFLIHHSLSHIFFCVRLHTAGDPQNTIVNFITDSNNNYAKESFQEATISISNVKTTHFTFSGTSDANQTRIELEGESTTCNLIECRGDFACQYLTIDASKTTKVDFPRIFRRCRCFFDGFIISDVVFQ